MARYGAARKTTRVPRGYDQSAADGIRKYDEMAKRVGDKAVADHRAKNPFARYDAMVRKINSEVTKDSYLRMRRRGNSK